MKHDYITLHKHLTHT